MNARQSRPQAILWFERLYGASVVVSIVDLVLQWDDITVEEEFGAETHMMFVVTVALVVIMAYAVLLALWYFISHRASGIAKWLLVLISAVSIGLGAMDIADFDRIPLAFFLVYQALTWIAIVMLFRADARTWFRSKGKIALGDSSSLNDVFR